MELKRLWCTAEAEVSFTPEEADFLIECAKNHYDTACLLAGCVIGEEGARINGFIAQLKLFPGPDVWTFRKLNTALKILELHNSNELLRMKLSGELHAICSTLQNRGSELNGELW
jgi:hypothetical protein